MSGPGRLRVLVIGSGGREHALAWRLRQDPSVRDVLIAPGNAGTGSVGENVDVAADDIEGLVKLAIARRVDLTIVGPEIPLIAGVVDRFQEAGLKIFGPSKAAARIEGSKAWAKDVMERHGVPTARAVGFDGADEAIAYASSLPEASYVLKADGPAGGKGVVLPESHAEAEVTIRAMIDDGLFGSSGATVLVEDRINGPEISVFAFVCGTDVSPEVAACDYKRAFDGDEGPNTGGVGAYTPPEMWTSELAGTIRRDVLERVAKALVEEGCPYSGVIYAGLMLTTVGAKVIEFNCRFGDPETQVILPLFKGDFAEACMAVANGVLTPESVRWRPGAAAAVVVTSGGYPGVYKTGARISGIRDAEKSGLVFHAGTKLANGEVVTAGGRVLACVGQGDDLRTARGRAYDAAGKIEFEGAYYRTDIASRAITPV